MKRVAVLTSGGDSPGMNTAIRAVVRTGISEGVEVIGVRHGYQGLVDGNFTLMDAGSVSGIINQGGTILQSARSMAYKTPEGFAQAVDNLHQAGIEGLVVIGGNGSQRGNYELHTKADFPVIGVASTIDNDLYGSDYTIGFDTAVNTALESVDRLRDTATSHDRIFIIEVMGRSRGFVALHVGVAGGAEVVLLPEIPWTIDQVVSTIQTGYRRGKKSFLIVVAEGAVRGEALADQLKEATGYDTRATVLGHVQRGGSPSAADRVLASQLGSYAVKYLLEGKRGVLVGEQSNAITTTPLEEVWSKDKPLDPELLQLVHVLGA
ncbi:MAG TPA: 6-phosphofructokinase [Armatimonadota bacterium]|nr:6-phosphofructokinase [Armatimonadota bacterium]